MKESYKKIVSLVVLMFFSLNCFSVLGLEISDLSMDEAEFRQAIYGEPEWMTSYPNGLLNFIGAEYKMAETNDFFEFAIVRQGGTAGEATVKFKAFDMTAKYGEDYVVRVYENYKRNQIEVNPRAQALIDFSGEEASVNLSGNVIDDIKKAVEEGEFENPEETLLTEETLTDEIPEEEILQEEFRTEASEPSYQDLPKTELTDEGYVIEEKSTKSLADMKSKALGVESDRPNWQIADREATESLMIAYDQAFGPLEGAETTVTFLEGEYIKYLYIVPVNDKIYKGDRQALFMLGETGGGAFRGESHMASVNIADDDAPEPFNFALNKKTAYVSNDRDKVELTVTRSGNLKAPAVINVGTASDSAGPGADYLEGTQTLFFPAGVTQKQVVVSILPNETRTSDREFAVMLKGLTENINPDYSYTVVTIQGNSPVLSNEEETSFSASAFEPANVVPQPTIDGILRPATVAEGARAEKGSGLFDLTYGNNQGSYYNAVENSVSVQRTPSRLPVDLNYRLNFIGVEQITYTDYNTDNTFYTNKEYGGYVQLSHGNYGIHHKGKIANGNTPKESKTIKPYMSLWNFTYVNRLGIYAYSKSNSSNYTVQNIVFDYKKFNIKVLDADNLPFYEYELNNKGELVKNYNPVINAAPVKLKIGAISSALNNNAVFPANSETKTSEIYYNDVVNILRDENAEYMPYGTYKLQYRIGNSSWKDLKLANGQFYFDMDFFFLNTSYLYNNDTIEIKPVYTRYPAFDHKIGFEVNDLYKNSGIGLIGIGDSALSGYTKTKTFNSLPGDYIIVTGKRAYRTMTPLWTNGDDKITPRVDIPGIEDTMSAGYQIKSNDHLKFELVEPSFKIMGSPDSYSHRVDNSINYIVKDYILGGIPRTSSLPPESFANRIDTALENADNINVTINFGYKWDDISGRDEEGNLISEKINDDSRKLLGNIPTAVLTVYKSDGTVRETYELEHQGGSYPNNLAATYSISGYIFDLGWQKGDYATVYFKGSNMIDVVTGGKSVKQPIRTSEVEISFISGAGGTVIAMPEDGEEGYSRIGLPYYQEKAEYREPYSLVSLVPIGFITRWIDASDDYDNDGYNNIDKGRQWFYGNAFSHTLKNPGLNKLYYEYAKGGGVEDYSRIKVKLLEETYYATDSKKKISRPASSADVFLFGNKIGSTDENGELTYMAYGLVKGCNYLLNITYNGATYTGYALAGGDAMTVPIGIADRMRAEFVRVNGKGITKHTYNELTILDKSPRLISSEPITMSANGADLEIGSEDNGLIYELRYDMDFKFVGNEAPVTPNVGLIRIYKKGTVAPVYTSRAIAVDPDSGEFNLSGDDALDLSKIIVGKNPTDYDMRLVAQYWADGRLDYEYPEFPSGVNFIKSVVMLQMASAVSAPGTTLDIVGEITTDYYFSAKVDSTQLKQPRYLLDDSGKYSKKPKVSVGLEVSKLSQPARIGYEIPQIQKIYSNEEPTNAEPHIINPGIYSGDEELDDGTAEPDENVNPVAVLRAVFEPEDTNASVAEKGGSAMKVFNNPENGFTAPGVDPAKVKPDEAGNGPASGEQDVNDNNTFAIKVFAEVIFDVPFEIDAFGEARPSSRTFFDSMALTVTGIADQSHNWYFAGPIGLMFNITLNTGGQLTFVLGMSAVDKNLYRQLPLRDKDKKPVMDADGNPDFYYVYELDEYGVPLGFGEFWDIDFFDVYARFLLYPTISLGVAAGWSFLSAHLTGSAVFDLEFNTPGYGGDYWTGQGGITLEAKFGVKILFIRKDWSIARKRYEFFNWNKASAAAFSALEDPYRNYLYEDADIFDVESRDYLNYRSEWNKDAGSGFSASSVEPVTDTIIAEGVYPNPKTGILDLGNGKVFMLFVDDVNAYNNVAPRDEYNRTGVFYTVYDGSSWSYPALLDDDDGTWDDFPDAKFVDGRIFTTFTDCDRVFTAETGAAEVVSGTNISGRWFSMQGVPVSESFEITWTSDSDGNKTNDFDISNVYDMFGDVEPKISYDEETERLLVYYTKTDYINQSPYSHVSGEDPDMTTIGDIVNAYSVIAYRVAEKDSRGEFVFKTDYEVGESYDDGFYGQRFLDLAVPVKINEEFVTRTFNGMESTYEMEVIEQTLVACNTLNDPRVVMSDVITYNGLSLYTYVMDEDSDLQTITDQEIYMQIYNYEENSFSIPIQITNNMVQDTRPQYVRVNGITYLYFISDGDIKYINITDLIKYGLVLKDIPGSDKQVYIINKDGADTTDGSILTAVKYSAEENEKERKLVDNFSVGADNTSDDVDSTGVYLLWSVLEASPNPDVPEEENPYSAENLINSKGIYAAYTIPSEKHVKEVKIGIFTVDEEDEGKFEFIFKDGAVPHDTYPEAVRILAEEGMTYNDILYPKDSIITFDYNVETDINGFVGLVSAGDPVVFEGIVKNPDSFSWSKPVSITPIDGYSYTDLSFIVNGKNDLSISYMKYKETGRNIVMDDDGNVIDSNIEADMTDLSTTSLAYGRYILSSELLVSDVVVDTETPIGGLFANFYANITNTGLVPIENISVQPYILQNGVETYIYEEPYLLRTTYDDRSYLLGGDVFTIEGTAILPEDIKDLSVGFKLWVYSDVDSEPDFNINSLLKAEKVVFAESIETDVLDKDNANIRFTVQNVGNLPYNGKIQIRNKNTKAVVLAEDVFIPEKSLENFNLNCEITQDMFTIKSAEGFEGSIYDAIPLEIALLNEDGSTEDMPAAYSADIIKSASEAKLAMMNNIKSFSVESAVSVAQGEKHLLSSDITNINPIPDDEFQAVDILWSSDNSYVTVNSYGIVSVSEDAPVGTRAIITARLKPFSNVVYANTDGSFTTLEDVDLLPDAVIKTAVSTVTVLAGSQVNGGGGVRPPAGNSYSSSAVYHSPSASSAPSASEAALHFADVLVTDWYYSAVEFVRERSLFNGTGDNNFSPNETMTRAMLVTVLYRMENEPEAEGVSFDDVPDDEWYSKAVSWAAANGIVNGVGDNNFSPNENVSREQIVTMLYRYYKFKGNSDLEEGDLEGFRDSREVSEYAREAMLWAVSYGVINGTPEGNILPKNDATRAEAATMLQRYLTH